MLGKVLSFTLVASAAEVFTPPGRYLRVLEATGPFTLTFYDDSGQPIGEFVDVEAGFAVDAAVFHDKTSRTSAIFGRVGLSSATSQTVQVAVTRVPVDYDRITGSVTATLERGSVNDQQAVATVGVAAAQVVAAGSGRVAVRYAAPSTNTAQIAIGGTDVTLAGAPVVLNPGDSFLEDLAPNAEQYAVAAAAAQSLKISILS